MQIIVESEDYKVTRRVDFLAAATLTLLYIALVSGHFQSIDGMIMFQEARSLLYDRSLVFREPINWGNPIFVSKYGLGLPLLYLPGLTIFSWLEPYVHHPIGDSDFGRLYLDPVFAVVGIPVQILATSASAYLVSRFCRRLRLGHAASLSSLALFGVASPALVYTRADFSQPIEAFCWICSLYFALRFRELGRLRDCVGCTLALFYAILTRPFEGLILLPATLALLVPYERAGLYARQTWNAGILALTGVVIAAAITITVNYVRYGHWLQTGYQGEGWTTSVWIGVSGFLLSPARGLLWSFPSVVLLPLGLRKLWLRKRSDIVIALGGSTAALIGVMSTWWNWWGGVNWGPRLIFPAMPLLAVIIGVGISAVSERRRTLVVSVLAAAGLFWALPCVFVDLHAGYGGAFDGTLASFLTQAHPGIGAWRYVNHWFSYSVNDISGVDILWFRLARATYGLSLIPFFGCLLLSLRLLHEVKSRSTLQTSK